MTHWTKPAALSEDPPRRAKIKMKVITLPIIILFLIWLFPLFIAPFLLSTHYEERILRERGVESKGVVLSKNLIKSKKGHFYELWYEYEIPENIRFQKLKWKGAISIEENEYIIVNDLVPILYDANKPYISRLNINDRIRTNRKIDRENFLILFVSVSILLPCLFSFLLIFPVYRKSHREKHILRVGKVAPATLVEMKSYSFRGLPLLRVSFRFVDEAGRSVQGICDPYVGERVEDLTAASAGVSTITNLTVVYDPKDSRKNLLYPARYVELR